MSTIIDCIQAAAKARKVSPMELSRMAGISYRAAHELLHTKADRPQVSNAERALFALLPSAEAHLRRAAEKLTKDKP